MTPEEETELARQPLQRGQRVLATKDGRTGLVVKGSNGYYTVRIDDEHGGGRVKLRGYQLQIDDSKRRRASAKGTSE